MYYSKNDLSFYVYASSGGIGPYRRYLVVSKELEQVLMDEWRIIPADEVRKLHDSIPRRIEAVHKAGGGPTPH